MLHILLGRAKSGRTGIMAKRAGRDIVNGRRAAFIVPDQETFITESRLLTENNFNGLMEQRCSLLTASASALLNGREEIRA